MTHHLTTRLRTYILPLCALGFTLSLSGCSSQDNTQATPSPSTSSADSFAITSTEGIENPELPERPPAMDTYDEDGAIAAAEYFLRLSLYGFATGNWDDYNTLSNSECAFCQSYRDDRIKNRDSSTKQNMPEIKIHDSIAWTHEENPEQIRVNLVAEQYPCIATHPDGTITKSDGQVTALAFLMEYTDDWHVLAVLPFDADEYYADSQEMTDE